MISPNVPAQYPHIPTCQGRCWWCLLRKSVRTHFGMSGVNRLDRIIGDYERRLYVLECRLAATVEAGKIHLAGGYSEDGVGRYYMGGVNQQEHNARVDTASRGEIS